LPACPRSYPLAGLPKKLKRDDLQEATAQPLLNYILALSRRRGVLDLTATANLNAIYADLLEAVWERRWRPDQPQRQLPDVQGLSKANFQRVFEEIALSAWHAGDVRVVAASAVQKACEANRINDKLMAFRQGAEQGAVSLLAAFYTRQAGFTAGGEPAFEFTHKSFGEYLAALRLVRGIEQLVRQRAAREADLDFGWDERGALEQWAKLAGPSAVDRDLYVFIEREVGTRDEAAAAEWQRWLAGLLGFAGRHDWPMEKLTGQCPTFARQRQQARNAEEGLLATLHACARRSRQVSAVPWEGPFAVSDLLHRLAVIGLGSKRWQALRYLGRLELVGQSLLGTDLWGANLKGANLEGANLESAYLRDADLEGARLEHAVLPKGFSRKTLS
jgi:hypothetical protein